MSKTTISIDDWDMILSDMVYGIRQIGESNYTKEELEKIGHLSFEVSHLAGYTANNE
mgnify:CR=1 FL=1